MALQNPERIRDAISRSESRRQSTRDLQLIASQLRNLRRIGQCGIE